MRAIVEVLTVSLSGLTAEEFALLVRECDFPSSTLDRTRFTRDLDTKGFWRFEKDKDPELRIAVLAQVAFRELERVGPRNFLQMNDNDGWMLPETLRLAPI
ncbi:MAG: hypothetical protein ACUVXB_18135, partial [Bryobacteraceae bacterium]